MTDRDLFDAAAAALGVAGLSEADLCGPFVAALLVSGAAVTTLGNPLGTETVCASDSTAARIDEIQADLGEGPSWVARETGRPVFEPDLQHGSGALWPGARAALRATGVGAVHAFPMVIGDLRIGSVGLYTGEAGALTAPQMVDASALSSIVARQVLQRVFRELASGGPEMPDGRYSRREIHQASGMVSAQLDIAVDDALVLLRGYAFANDQPLRDVAREVVERRLDFRDPGEGGS